MDFHIISLHLSDRKKTEYSVTVRNLFVGFRKAFYSSELYYTLSMSLSLVYHENC
jgi:hypothetical protein